MQIAASSPASRAARDRCSHDPSNPVSEPCCTHEAKERQPPADQKRHTIKHGESRGEIGSAAEKRKTRP